MAAVMLIAWAGAAVGSSGVESLFFSRFGVQHLPEMFIALGLVTFPVTLAVSGLLAGPDRPANASWPCRWPWRWWWQRFASCCSRTDDGSTRSCGSG
jgi:hypothetical protein